MNNTAMSNWAEDEILDMVLRNVNKTPPTNVYLALLIAYTEGGTVTEVADANYARQQLTFGSAASGKSISTTAGVSFPAADAQFNYTHLAIYDASTAGNLIYAISAGGTITVDAAEQVSVNSGELTVSQGGAFSTYLANIVLDFWLRAVDYSQVATVYASLLEAFTDADTLTETTYTGYSRQAYGAEAAVDGATQNASAIDYPTNTGSSVDIVGVALHDASSAGNVLFAKGFATTAVANNRWPSWAAGALDLTLD